MLSSHHRVLNPSVRHVLSRLRRWGRLTAEIRSPERSERGETVNRCLIQKSLMLETCYLHWHPLADRRSGVDYHTLCMICTRDRGTQVWIHNDRKRTDKVEWLEKDRIICRSFSAAYLRLWSRKSKCHEAAAPRLAPTGSLCFLRAGLKPQAVSRNFHQQNPVGVGTDA